MAQPGEYLLVSSSPQITDDGIAAVVDANDTVIEWRELGPGAFADIAEGHTIVMSEATFAEFRRYHMSRLH